MNAHNNLTLRTEAHPARAGYYMHTAPTGHKFWALDPRADEVRAETIAHHLACQGRYAGATQHRTLRERIFYSVAEHSVYCSWYVERDLNQPEHALEALLHDAPEAYLQDMIRPLKYTEELGKPYRAIESVVEAVVAEAFNLVHPFPEAIKIADEAVCSAEVNQIIVKATDQEWESGRLHDASRVAPYEIRMLPPYQALEFFKRRYNELIAVRSKYRPLPSRIAAL